MKINGVVIVTASLFAASLAQAQYYWGGGGNQGMGPYFRMGIGPSFFQNSQLKGFTIAAPIVLGGVNGPSGRVNYDVGFAGTGAFGFAFDQYVGLDFESGYIWARMDSVQNYSVNNSDMGNIPFLANLTLSYPIPHSNVIPYIGGGAGGSDSIFFADHFLEPVSTVFAQGSEADVVFAWQAFAGVRFMLNPNISVGVGYKYFSTGNPTFSYPPSPNLDVHFQGVRTHSIMFTFQANF